MPFSLQDPFDFNVEISVSWEACRYHDVAGFRPRVQENLSGAPGDSHAYDEIDAGVAKYLDCRLR